MDEPVADDAEHVVKVADVAFADDHRYSDVVDPKVMELEYTLRMLRKKYKSLQENHRELAKLNTWMLYYLQCRGCHRYLHNKVNRSCEYCYCKRPQAIQNLILSASSKVQRSCKYAREGCYFASPLKETTFLELHEQTCGHRFQCKFFLADDKDDEIAYCQWRGKFAEYRAHCNDAHRTAIINAKEAVLRLPMPSTSVRSYFEISVPFYCDNRFFVVVFYYRNIARNRALVPVTMLVESISPHDFEKIRISIKFASSRNDMIEFICSPREPIREDFAAILVRNSHLDRNLISRYSKGETIDCKVRIQLK